MTEECFACGNTHEEEIEYKTVYVDDGFSEVKKQVWVCIDDDECGMRIFGNKH